jgi:hypothetical protein
MWRGRKDDVADITPLSCNSITLPATPEKMTEGQIPVSTACPDEELAQGGFGRFLREQ